LIRSIRSQAWSNAIATVAPLLAQLVAHLVGGVQRVEGHCDGAEAQHREPGDEELWAVRQDQRDPVAALHAERGQAVREDVCEPAQLPVAHAVAEVHQGGAAAVPLGRVVEQPSDRNVRDFHVLRNAAGVEFQPGARKSNIRH
jgi:hypothetical protein